MKLLARSAVVSLLALLAKAVIRRYKPKVVMVTGSVGKTSTKDALALALSTKFLVRKSEKSANSEFGVPFTIFGVGSPWENPLAWVRVFSRAIALILLPNHYPELLVLEVGADHPGDLAKILKIAKPSAVVVTRLPEIPVHVEFYETPAEVREEEFSPAKALLEGAPLVIFAEDTYAKDLAEKTNAKIATFGLSAGASVRLQRITYLKEKSKVIGMKGVLSAGEEHADIAVVGAVGKTQLLPLAAAVALAHAFNISLADSTAALARYDAPPGRGRVFAGVGGTTIIDDSYNASPAAVEEALATLAGFPMGAAVKGSGAPAAKQKDLGAPSDAEGIAPSSPRRGRRVAVLGDMLELGRYSVEEHERIGALAATMVDVAVAVGIRTRGLASASLAAGLPKDSVLSFDDSAAAAAALPAFLKEGDVVLVKGSQSIRVERIVEALLANPADRANLPRQERAWQKR